MQSLLSVILVIHLLIALALIATVLLQRSEGGALGIGGGGGSLFTSRGVGNALTRVTAILAAAFFVTSITLTLLSTRGGGGSLITTPQGQGTGQESVLPNLPEPPKAPQVPVQQ